MLTGGGGKRGFSADPKERMAQQKHRGFLRSGRVVGRERERASHAAAQILSHGALARTNNPKDFAPPSSVEGCVECQFVSSVLFFVLYIFPNCVAKCV